MNPFEGLSDEKLMKLYLIGENLAFDVIYHRYKEKVFGYLTRRLQDESDVREVFQNVFLKFHKSRRRYNPQYPLLKWVYTLSRSELLDHGKKKKIKTQVFEEERDLKLDENSRKKSSKGIDLEDMSLLSEQEKQAISLRYFSEMEYEEIGETLRTSGVNTRKIVSRGLAKLRKYFVRKAAR